MATATDGTSRPVSMALISVRETAPASASCSWDQPRRSRCCARAEAPNFIMSHCTHDNVSEALNPRPAAEPGRRSGWARREPP